jgi:tetratricopeptide (TPR) repeat protein
MAKRIIVTILTACFVLGAVFAQQNARTLITQGQDHLRQGNYAEAVTAFEAALKLEPRNRQVPPLLKEAQQKRSDEAFNQAQQLQQEGKYQEAIALYNSAIRYAPPGTNTRNIQNRRDEAQRALSLAEQQEQNTLIEQQKAREEQERALAEQQRAQEQAVLAQSARERAEQSQQAVQRANELFIGGKYPDAIAQYEHAITTGGLNAAETTETQRLIAEARDVQTKMDSYNRALKDDDFEVSQNTNGTVTVTKYKASESKTVNIGGVSHTVHFGILNVVIPARIWGVNLTGIGNEAFKNAGIVTVVIPDTVTEIGYGAFYGNNLERVTMGRAIRTIRGGVAQGRMEVSELGAFEGNKNLKEILIPDTITEIGARAFKDCGLTSVTIGRAVSIIGESAFRNNKLPVVTLPASIRTIRRYAFHQNEIQSLTLPNGILEVFDDAFTKNPMTAIVIPPSLATLTKINNLDCPRIGGDHAHYSAFTPTFPDTLVRVTIPANMHADNMRTFEENLRNYYISSNRVAGTYVKNGPIWTR